MAYKAEYQVVEITQEQWNKIGQKLGITGLAAKRKAVSGLARIIWNRESDFVADEETEFDELFYWGGTHEGHKFWYYVYKAIKGELIDDTKEANEMTEEEKRSFVKALFQRAMDSILEKVSKMPEEWDGVEIRQYCSDYVQEHFNWAKMSKKRKTDYNNEVIVRDL